MDFYSWKWKENVFSWSLRESIHKWRGLHLKSICWLQFFFLMFRNVFRTETLSGFRWRQEWSGWRWKWWKLKLDLKNFSCMLFLRFLANLRFWVLGLYCNYLMWPQENSMTALTFLVPTLFPQSHVHLILQGHWIEK